MLFGTGLDLQVLVSPPLSPLATSPHVPRPKKGENQQADTSHPCVILGLDPRTHATNSNWFEIFEGVVGLEKWIPAKLVVFGGEDNGKGLISRRVSSPSYASRVPRFDGKDVVEGDRGGRLAFTLIRLEPATLTRLAAGASGHWPSF